MWIILVSVLGACVGGKDTSSEDSADSGAVDSGVRDTSDSRDTDTWRDPTKAYIVVTLGLDVGGLFAMNSEGDGQPMGGPFPSGGLEITEVDPGQWWCVAYDAAMTACNRSAATDLVAGGELDWTVSDLPGTFDGDTGECLFP